MFKHITFSDFCDEWEAFDRNNSFTYHGKQALFNYLESQEIESENEMDIIEIDGRFFEYESIEVAVQAYSHTINTIEQLKDLTTVIMVECSNTVIIAEC